MRLTTTTIEISLDEDQSKSFDDPTIFSVTFTAGMITDCKIHEEISLISEQLVPKSCEFSFHIYPDDWAKLSGYLKKNQKLKVSVHLKDDRYGIDKDLNMGIFYLRSWERGLNNISTIKSVGFLAVMDTKNSLSSYIYIPPGENVSNTKIHRTVEEWAQSFFSSQSEYELDPVYTSPNSVYLTGSSPHTTKKDRLKRVAFSIGAVIEENRDGKILIYPQEKNITFEIKEDRMIVPVKETKNNPVSTINIDTYEYTYKKYSGEEEDPYLPPNEVVFSGYLNAGTQRVYYNKPIRTVIASLLPTGITFNSTTAWNGSFTVNTAGNYEVRAWIYDETLTTVVYQSNVNNVENAISVKENQLVTSYNVSDLSNNLFDTYKFYVSFIDFKYISNGEEVGWFGSFQTNKTREAVGTIVSQDINVSGGLIVTAKAQISGFRNIVPNFTGEEYWTGEDFGLI